MQPDINFRAALALAGWRPTHPLEKAAEYFEFDFEFGGEPEDTSLQSNADVRADTSEAFTGIEHTYIDCVDLDKGP